jgi:hypothetical protein
MNRISVAKKLIKIAKNLIASDIVKISDSNQIKGYDAYLVKKTSNV